MNDGISKNKQELKDGSLVRIVPIEVDKESKDKLGEKRVMNRHWQADKLGRFFVTNLNLQQLKTSLIKARVKMENLLLKEENGVIVYMYKGRPMIRLNIKEGQFYTSAATVEEFGKEAVQHQAHIVLDILKTNGLSHAQRGKETFQSNARQLLSHLKTYNK
jgi:hypothetical protein